MTKQDSSRKKILSVKEMKADYAIHYPQYQPGAQTLKELKTGTGNTELTIVLGTWCIDSRIQLSHFYKILDEAGIEEDWAKLIYVDQSKRDEDGLTDDLDIIRVPTFIFKVEGKETGRIVEHPQLTLEEDILKILKQETPMPASIEPGWLAVLLPEFEKPYMKALKNFLTEEAHAGQTIFPKNSAIFNAFNLTPFDKVEVVILGQDPYHGAGQAHGLSFSVKKGVVIPPSLKNIYKELETDIEGFKTPDHGELTQWAEEGVLLLNATLTVRAGQPGSHQGKGWEAFIDQAITQLSARKTGLVFILWGKFAQNKAILIDEQKHTVIKSPHPSPFSAYTGFFGSKPFSKTNEALIAKGKKPINWQIS